MHHSKVSAEVLTHEDRGCCASKLINTPTASVYLIMGNEGRLDELFQHHLELRRANNL